VKVGRLWIGVCLVALTATGGPAAAAVAPHGPPFAFGGVAVHGAYMVTVATDGSVRTSGEGGLARVGVNQLGSAQIAALNRVASTIEFGNLPAVTRCPGTQSAADVSWDRIGTRKVTVYGTTCLPGYRRLLTALKASVHFFSSG
jgi:hypothetical protein